MAMTFDAPSSSNTQALGAATSLTWAHTVSGNYLVVTINNGNGSSPACTYNSVSMNHRGTVRLGAGNQDIYDLLNPSTGTHNIIYSQGSAGNYLVEGLSLNNAPTGTLASNFQSSQTSTTAPSVSVTTVNAGAFIVSTLLDQNPPSTGTPTVTDSSTAYGSNGITGVEQSIASYISRPTIGTYTTSWSVPGTANAHVLTAFEVSSPAAAAPTGNFLVMMG